MASHLHNPLSSRPPLFPQRSPATHLHASHRGCRQLNPFRCLVVSLVTNRPAHRHHFLLVNQHVALLMLPPLSRSADPQCNPVGNHRLNPHATLRSCQHCNQFQGPLINPQLNRAHVPVISLRLSHLGIQASNRPGCRRLLLPTNRLTNRLQSQALTRSEGPLRSRACSRQLFLHPNHLDIHRGNHLHSPALNHHGTPVLFLLLNHQTNLPSCLPSSPHINLQSNH